KEWHELADIVEDALETQGPAAAEKSIALRSEVPRDRVRLRCDRHRLLQVLANLLGNAIKFTPNDGKVELTVYRAETEVLFSVTDTGCGISKEELPHVFERSWQA